MKLQDILEEKIAENILAIVKLEQENQLLKIQRESLAKNNLTGVKKWIGHTFESSSGLTPEWATFARDYKKHIKSILPSGAELISYYRGHFEVSGFIRRNEKYVYFSISDVRFFRDEWHKNILIRTAKHDKDYTGGSNRSTTLDTFNLDVKRLLEK